MCALFHKEFKMSLWGFTRSLFFFFNFLIFTTMKQTFREITNNIGMILFNDIIKVDYELELEAWGDCHLYSELYTKEDFESQQKQWEIPEDVNYNDTSDTYKDIYQYYAIYQGDGEYISKITWMPLYYSPKCDLHILWVDFLDRRANVSYEVKRAF